MRDSSVDVVVVGAGFAGLRSLHTMREKGFSVAVLDEAEDIGGVWFWNRYPGARCDVESFDYSYGFSPELDQEWRWSERYAAQDEILRYINHVADRFDLRRDIHLQQRVARAEYDESTGQWSVHTETGDRWTATYLVLAVGQLSTTKAPVLPGQDEFRGEIHHTARWPREGVDFTGKRVGIIGTGSSGTQMVPIVAEQAEHLTVFQRTPNFSVPACNAPISDEEDARIKATYPERRAAMQRSPSGLGIPLTKQLAVEATPEERRARFEEAWAGFGFGFALSFPDLLLDRRANDLAADFIREKITEKVTDPSVRERLMPHGYPFAAKRPCVDCGYFETFNRDDVTLVDVRTDRIKRVTPDGIETESGHHDLDIIAFATGFDALTGSLLRMQITGKEGQPLKEAWAAGPLTYLGLGVPGFPNMFIIAGPGSPSLLSNVILSIEQHVDWISELLVHAREHGIAEIEADLDAARKWVAHVKERADATLYPQAQSYYMGDEMPDKPRVFLPYSGGVRGYRRILEKAAEAGYDGFTLRRAAQPVEA